MRGSGDYDRKKKDTVVCLAGCAVVLCQFLVLSGNWQFFCCGGKFSLQPEKKDTLRMEKKRYSRLWREISIFFVVAGNFDYDRKKKRYSRLLAGNWQFSCCGGKFSLRPEKKRYITTKKKKY